MNGLKENQEVGLDFGFDFLLQYKPVIGWYAVSVIDRPPYWYNFVMGEERAYNEIINTIFKTGNKPVIRELEGNAKKRSEWISKRIEKLFDNRIKPLDYYMKNDTEAFIVLPSEEAFYISFKEEQDAVGTFNTKEFGYVDMNNVPEYLIPMIKETLKQDYRFMVSKFLKTSPKEHLGVLFEFIEDEKTELICYSNTDIKLNMLYECLDYNRLYDSAIVQELISKEKIGFTCGEFRPNGYRVQNEAQELYSPILNESFPFLKTFNQVKLKKGFFSFYVNEKLEEFRTNSS
jgi:hypothetical protein